jgi:hypothetical protein
MPATVDLDHWKRDLSRLSREMEKDAATHPDWPRCSCDLCESLDCVHDALFYLNRVPDEPLEKL